MELMEILRNNLIGLKISFFAYAKTRAQISDSVGGNRAADQHLCFRYIDSTAPLLSKPEILSL